MTFQISATIYAVVARLLCFVIIGILIADLVLVIIAGVKANDGISSKYPATIRFLK